MRAENGFSLMGVLLRRCGLAAAFGLLLGAPVVAKEEAWLRVTTPEFTMVTSLTQKEAVVWAEEFAQYITELRSLFKIKRPLPPLTIVVFARERAYQDYRPLDEKGKPQPADGFFLRHNSWAVAGLAGAHATEDVRRIIFHEGVHWFLSALDQPNPVWIEEGLAEVFSTFAALKKKVEWGHSIPEHVLLLREENLLSIDRLLYVGRSELFRDKSSHTGVVYSQSWITVHFLIFGDNPQIPRSALFDFIKLTNEGVSTADAFRRAVGSDLATFDRRLKDYLRSGRYFIHHKPLEARLAVRAEPAAPVEVAQALGRLALAAHRWEKATEFAQQAIAIAPDDPRGFELLGLARSEGGDESGGLKAFASAAEKGSMDFQPYFALASAAQKAAVNDAGEVTELKPGEARLIADRYERAIVLSPRVLAAYQNLAGILVAAEIQPQDRHFLELGQKMFPGDGWIRIGLAVLTERGGDRTAALKSVNEVEANVAEVVRVRNYARKLSDGWTLRDVSERIDSLVNQQKFVEALGYLEQQLDSGASANLRSHLSTVRPQLKAAARSQEIGRALAEQRWDDARQLLTDTISSRDMPPLLKQQSQRTLDDLNRRTPVVRRPTKL
ncbi:MAG: hypothetical protein ABIZ81_11715 [Opitutaceae bacterium]